MSLDKIGGEGHKDYYEPQGEINKALPLEIFEKILVRLDGLGVQQASLVGHLWSVGAIDTAKQKEFSIIKGFIKFLCDSCGDQSKSLLDVAGKTEILGSINLLQIKNSILETKESLLEIVKGLSTDALNELENQSQNQVRPLFFENFFELAKLYQQLDKVDEMQDGKPKDLALLRIVVALVQYNNMDKAIFVVNKMTIPYSKWKALECIINGLLLRGNEGKAMEVADTIEQEVEKDIAFRSIAKASAQSGKEEKTFEAINRLSDRSKWDACADVCLIYLQKLDFEPAEKLAEFIQDKDLKQHALFIINLKRNDPDVDLNNFK